MLIPLSKEVKTIFFMLQRWELKVKSDRIAAAAFNLSICPKQDCPDFPFELQVDLLLLFRIVCVMLNDITPDSHYLDETQLVTLRRIVL